MPAPAPVPQFRAQFQTQSADYEGSPQSTDDVLAQIRQALVARGADVSSEHIALVCYFFATSLHMHVPTCPHNVAVVADLIVVTGEDLGD